MAKPLLMPQVGQDIETAVICKWLVKEGDKLNVGDIYVEVESEKAAFEVEAEAAGTVLKLLYEEWDEVKVLEPIAWVGEPGEKPEDAGAGDSEVKQDRHEAEEEKKAVREENSSGDDKILAAPAARRVASEHGIDLGTIRGSGPGGRIVKADVLAAVAAAESTRSAEATEQKESKQPIPAEHKSLDVDTEIPFSKIRKKIAERLTLSKQTIPHFYLFGEVNMSAALAWREKFNRESGGKVSINDIIIKAAASALTEYRGVNAHVIDDKQILRKQINIGVAVSTDDSLLVPVIPNADSMDIKQLSALAAENARNARKGLLKAGAVGTFTVSNLGMYAVNAFLPIINPPECAIMGVGSLQKKVVLGVVAGIDTCDMMTLTLACDHRVLDGAYAAGFLGAVRKNLEEFSP